MNEQMPIIHSHPSAPLIACMVAEQFGQKSTNSHPIAMKSATTVAVISDRNKNYNIQTTTTIHSATFATNYLTVSTKMKTKTTYAMDALSRSETKIQILELPILTLAIL